MIRSADMTWLCCSGFLEHMWSVFDNTIFHLEMLPLLWTYVKGNLDICNAPFACHRVQVDMLQDPCRHACSATWHADLSLPAGQRWQL